jgi:ribosomal-protein-alanine N-acetyltransferase
MPTETNEEIRIRTIESSHIGDIMRIADETGLSHWSAQSYLDEMKNPDAIMLRVADGEDLVAGFIVGRLVQGGDIEVRTDAEIYNIAVDRPKQGRGLGQVLLDAFVEQCTSKAAEQVWLEVRQSNRPAIAFYERNGFEHVQTRNHFYTDPPEHALLMRLDLKIREG